MSRVYAGKDGYASRGRPTATATHSTKIIFELAEQYLKTGRTVTTDNYYTSVALAKMLLESQAHLFGTLRKNRAGYLKAVTDAHLKKDEVVGRENEDGIAVAKWRSKSEVLMLLTKHDLKMVDTGRTDAMKKS